MKQADADGGSGPAEQSGAAVTLAVGTRVRTYVSASPDADGGVPEAGVIVDDFGEVLRPHEHYGRDGALTKRWAIALDTGSLVFRDDNELERESGH